MTRDSLVERHFNLKEKNLSMGAQRKLFRRITLEVFQRLAYSCKGWDSVLRDLTHV